MNGSIAKDVLLHSRQFLIQIAVKQVEKVRATL